MIEVRTGGGVSLTDCVTVRFLSHRLRVAMGDEISYEVEVRFA